MALRAIVRLRHLTCGRAGARSRTRMPHAQGAAPARRGQPETRWHYATKDENGRTPRVAWPAANHRDLA
jgi:hypothetical protein